MISLSQMRMMPAPNARRAKQTTPIVGPPIAVGELARMTGDVTARLEGRAFAWHLNPVHEAPAVLAFDCGKEMGVALVSAQGKLLRSEVVGGVGHIEGVWAKEVENAIATAILRARGNGVLLVVVEDAFVLRGPKANPATLAHLAFYIGGVIAAAASAGLPALRVYPTTWQSKLLGKIRRDQGKELSVRVARSHFGPSITSDHQADAALLALYVRGGR